MKIIDLSQPLFDKMPVYPGDPEVSIKEIHILQKEGWNLRQVTVSTHIGTHVNAPYHMTTHGKTLDDLPLERFIGNTVLYEAGMIFQKDIGVIFHSQNIDKVIVEEIIKTPPKFIGLSAEFEFDLDVERMLCEHDIISFENLVHTDQLPKKFVFYGVPLNIQKSDGSPIRAYAVVT